MKHLLITMLVVTCGATGTAFAEAEPAAQMEPATGAESPYQVGIEVLSDFPVGVGWAWRPWKGLTLRAAIGGAFTVGAGTSVEPEFQPLVPGLHKPFTTYCENYLDDIYTTYVFTPTVSLAVGWQIWPWR